MNEIKKIFLTKTIPDIICKRYGMSCIKFVFDKNTLEELSNDLKIEFQRLYNEGKYKECKICIEGLKSLLYLWKNNLKNRYGSDDIYIPVHDSNQFFCYLQELIELYSKRRNNTITDPENFIRSIWLRMSSEDIENVEDFLSRQISFIKNESVLDEFNEVTKLNNEDEVLYQINENEEWFETNKNIVFSIRRKGINNSSSKLFISPSLNKKEYAFPAIHFAITSEGNKKICYLYGIQQIKYDCKDEDIKEYIQPIRKKLRNKHVSSDILIALSLFFDYLYREGIKDVVVPTLQVFNYPYHEQKSEFIKSEQKRYFDKGDNSYSEEYRDADRYIDKQDGISYNKSERLIYSIIDLYERYQTFNIINYPYFEGKNIQIKINGEMNLLDINPKTHTL